eukprot:14399956-Heterocapsa_arctica.AAC.1
MSKHTEHVQVSTLLECSRIFIYSQVKYVENNFIGPPVDRHVFNELFSPGGLLPPPRFPIGDAQASSTNSSALHERRAHTTSPDFILQLCFWLRDLRMSNFATSPSQRTVKGGVDDETSAF